MMNIPIYRVKKIDSDEYVIGNLIEDEGVFYIIKNPVVTHFNGLQQLTGECEYLDRVDPSTLAIHFPDMIDSQGNKINGRHHLLEQQILSNKNSINNRVINALQTQRETYSIGTRQTSKA